MVPVTVQAAGGSATVTVFRPSHVGDYGTLDTTFAQHVHEVRTVGGGPPMTQDRDWTVHVVGRYTVEAVDARGTVTKLRIEVMKAVNGVNGDKSQLLPAATVIEATNPAGTTEYARADGVLLATQRAALQQVVTVRPPDAPTIDDLFPPGGPRAVGDSWPMDGEQFAAFNRAAHNRPAKRAAGEAKLVELTAAGGIPEMKIRQTIDVWDAAPTTRPGLTQSLTHGTTTYTHTVPVDPAVHGVTTDTAIANDYIGHGTDVGGAAVDVKTRYTIEKHWTTTPATP